MQPLDGLPPAIAFLTSAAHLLRTTAAETAAHLMRSRNNLLLASSGSSSSPGQPQPLSEVQRQHVCVACGNIMIPGFDGDTIRLEPAGAAHRRRKYRAARETSRVAAVAAGRLPAAAATKAAAAAASSPATEWAASKILTCGRCGSVTRIKLAAPGRVQKMRGGKKAAIIGNTAAADTRLPPPSPEKLSAAAGSKKRAKSRKAGLQALLSRSEPVRALGLADFAHKT